MKKLKTIIATILAFVIVVSVVLVVVYKNNNGFRTWVDTNFKLEQTIPDNTTSASTPTLVVIEELEANQKKIEEKVDNLKIEFENTDISNTEKLEALKSQLELIENELADVKYQIQLLRSNLTNYSNSNLLINGNFQINQRGQTSYSESTEYTVDRWMNSENSTTVTQTSKGIRLMRNNDVKFNRNAIIQSIERYEILEGRTVTCSIKVSDNSVANGISFGLSISKYVNSNSNKLIESSVYTSEGILTITGTLPETFDELKAEGYKYLNFYIEMDFEASENEYVDIEWAKLEFGSLATEYNPRLYAEELSLCQRYYLALTSAIGIGQINTSKVAIVSGSYPTSMRIINPTLKLVSGKIMVRSGNLYIYATNYRQDYGGYNNYRIQFDLEFESPVGNACDVFLENGLFEFNAEIY